MHPLKLFGRFLLPLLKQLWLLPRTIPAVFKQRRENAVLATLEAERLDRIRNPSDYLGR